MTKRLLAVVIGLAAGLALAGAYIAAIQFGVPIKPEWVVAGGAALVFAGAVAVFSLVAMDRPSFRQARSALLLNEDPAKEYIYFFRAAQALQITARADQSVGEILVRFGDAFKEPPEKMTKPIVVTIRGSAKKPFPASTLEQLFAVLKPYHLDHVVLMNDKEQFVGYIPGKRAAKEFTGDKAMANIDKYVVKLLINPEDTGALRELGGATADDTIKDTDYAMEAQAKLWTNDKIAGLIVHHKLRPVGFISKMDVLRINAGLL